MRNCPACDRTNLDTAAICRRCGKALKPVAVVVQKPYVRPIADLEREAIAHALRWFTRKDTALLLGVGRNWLEVRIERYGLSDIRFSRRNG